MIIKAIAPWFGGKRTLAPHIVIQLGEHTQYFEPYCGSMAVLFSKKPSQKETVNDLHGDLINLAEVVQYRPFAEELYERLQRTLFSEGLLREAGRLLTGPQELIGSRTDRAYWYFLACWMGRNGTAGSARVDYQIAVRWTKNGGSPTVRFHHAVDSIPAWHERLRNVVILNRDAFKMVDRFEDIRGTAVYLDPPYMAKSRTGYRTGSGSDYRYLHEFKQSSDLYEPDDHIRLAAILNRYKRARIVVSYYDSPAVRELYKGWTFLEHGMQKRLHSQAGRGSRPKEAPEVLIVNGPSFAV